MATAAGKRTRGGHRDILPAGSVRHTEGTYPGEELILAGWHADLERFEVILDPMRQRDLCRRAQAGDTQARDELVGGTLRLAEAIAARYARYTTAALPDLIQEGAIGLLRAIDKYDCERTDAKFSSYAVWWIQQGIARAALAGDGAIRVPEGMRRRVIHARKGTAFPPSIRAPQPADLEAANRADRVTSLQQMMRSGSTGEDCDTALAEVIPDRAADSEAQVLLRADREALARVLIDVLMPIERQVIVLRFGLCGVPEHTLPAVGRKLGFCRQRAQQIEARALAKLRRPHVQRRLLEASDAA